MCHVAHNLASSPCDWSQGHPVSHRLFRPSPFFELWRGEGAGDGNGNGDGVRASSSSLLSAFSSTCSFARHFDRISQLSFSTSLPPPSPPVPRYYYLLRPPGSSSLYFHAYSILFPCTDNISIYRYIHIFIICLSPILYMHSHSSLV